LIERESAVATQASGNKAGVFNPMITDASDPVGQFYLEAFYYAVQHFQTLSMTTKTLRWKQCGVLDMSPKKIAKDPKKTVLTLELLAKINEKLASHTAGIAIKSRAMYMPDCGYIDPVSICCANIKAFEELITVKYCTEAVSLTKEAQTWQVRGGDNHVIDTASVVILANAYDVASVSQSKWVPTRKIRGQVTYLPVSPETEKLQTVLCASGYMTPAEDGFHSIGATFDKYDECRDLRIEDHEKNINNFRQYITLPHVEYEQLEGRVSFRSASPDHRPIIGRLAHFEDFKTALKQKKSTEAAFHEGLYVSVAHGSRGVVSTPIAGEYLASLIDEDRKSPLSQQQRNMLCPSRFVSKVAS
jgi:tRNA 5-methylaminomethyl-2-thiouridine biosynthesis bifunctional protein